MKQNRVNQKQEVDHINIAMIQYLHIPLNHDLDHVLNQDVVNLVIDLIITKKEKHLHLFLVLSQKIHDQDHVLLALQHLILHQVIQDQVLIKEIENVKYIIIQVKHQINHQKLIHLLIHLYHVVMVEENQIIQVIDMVQKHIMSLILLIIMINKY